MKLIVFDVDGTLVDSQGDILAAMAGAFEGVGLSVPGRSEILSIVGLSLPQAMARLAPELDEDIRAQMVEGYKDSYIKLRAENGVAASSPLYPGMRDMLDALAAHDDVLLGVATGKSRKGLDKLLAGHRLANFFVTEQVADHHPSKPHPSMLLTAMAETGTAPDDVIMIGDTSFDMEMARAAKCKGIGVSWGYHPSHALEAAHHVMNDISELAGVVDDIWGLKL